MTRIYTFLLCLLFAGNMIGQGALNQTGFDIRGWSDSFRSYVDSMKQVSSDMEKRRNQLIQQSAVPGSQIGHEFEEHVKLLDRLNRIDASTRQKMMEDVLSRINQQLKGENALKFTGGTEPGNAKFRDGFGDYDLESHESSVEEIKQLFSKLLPPGVEIIETPDYIAIDELRFTIFKRRHSKNLESLKLDRKELLAASKDKEVYLFLRLPPPKEYKLVEPEQDRIYRDYIKALEIQGHLTKGIKGSKAKALDLFKDPEMLQTFAKSALKCIKAANLNDADIQQCLDQAGNSESVSFFRKFQLGDLPKTAYLNPFLVGLTPQNFGIFQNTIINILELANKKSKEQATKCQNQLLALSMDEDDDQVLLQQILMSKYLFNMQLEVNENYFNDLPESDCSAFDRCEAACGTPPDFTLCVTVRENPNTPEKEYYESPECEVIRAYRACMEECGILLEECITANMLRKYSQNNKFELKVENDYKGMVSDGFTRMRLTAKYPAGWKITKIEVTLGFTIGDEFGGPGDMIKEPGIAEVVLERNGSALIEYLPSSYTPPFDETVTVHFENEIGGRASKSVKLEIIRPPIVFVHGIWANHSSLGPIRNHFVYKESYSPYRTYRINYGPTSNQDLRKVVPILATKIDEILNRADVEGFKAKKVDIIAHSMGGLIARYYIEKKLESFDLENFSSKVRKLVTINTPHEGSSVADWYTDFFDNTLINCSNVVGNKPPIDKVTNNEYNWIIKILREEADMAGNPIALRYGPAVRQLQSKGRPGAISNKLSGKSVLNKEVAYFFIGGSAPLLSWCDLKQALLSTKLEPKYPYNLKKPGPCGESLGSGYGPDRKDVRKAPIIMAKDLVFKICGTNMDGVVQLESQFFNSASGIYKIGSATYPLNHFDVVASIRVHEKVASILTPRTKTINLTGMPGSTEIVSRSPGTIHVYNSKGEHVGKRNGITETHIEGAHYEPFTDIYGDHEYVYIPEIDNLRIEFEANKEGAVGLEIGQFSSEENNISTFKNVSVQPGDVLKFVDNGAASYLNLISINGQVTKINSGPHNIPQNNVETSQIITGIIKDINSDNSLSGVSIQSDERAEIDVSDIDGRFAVQIPTGTQSLYFEKSGKIIHSIQLTNNKSQDLGIIFIDTEQTIQITDDTGGKITLDDLEDTWPYILAGVVILIGGIFYIKKKKGSNQLDTMNKTIPPMEEPNLESTKQPTKEDSNKRFCTHCGNATQTDQKFCITCGNPLT